MCKSVDRGGTRTRSLRIRSPTPYPLGHTTANSVLHAMFWELVRIWTSTGRVHYSLSHQMFRKGHQAPGERSVKHFAANRVRASSTLISYTSTNHEIEFLVVCLLQIGPLRTTIGSSASTQTSRTISNSAIRDTSWTVSQSFFFTLFLFIQHILYMKFTPDSHWAISIWSIHCRGLLISSL